MNIEYLYKKMEQENINYVNSKLYATKGAIAHYKNNTAIVLDESQISTSIEEKTTLNRLTGSIEKSRLVEKLISEGYINE